MKLNKPTAEVFVPDGSPVDQAIPKTTHMAISAHQDDIEIMAYRGVLECFGMKDKGFMGVVVTNGAGSPRGNIYADYTDEMMQQVRRVEQRKAAYVGEYCAQAMLDYTSSEVKDGRNPDVVKELAELLRLARPEIVYTHNLADKHDTHVSVALRTISAIRKLPKASRPKHIYGCEVWRGLDWLNDDDKIVFNVEDHENLAAALLGVFDSQVSGGKRYDLATAGRRRANATYHAGHGLDETTALNYAMDLTPLIIDDTLDPLTHVSTFLDHFVDEVKGRVGKFG